MPEPIRIVLENTVPLDLPRRSRLPLFVLPISQGLVNVEIGSAARALVELDQRGIGYTVSWNPNAFDRSLKEALRIGTLQQRMGQLVAVDATACLHSFFDGTEATLHVDEGGTPFAETSFGETMGCPVALQHRSPVIARQVEAFLAGYRNAGLQLDFIFADWEIDGPIEWNDAWASSKNCRRCRNEIAGIEDFRLFQKRLRELRSEMQRITFGEKVTSYFPQALVGNYGVYPHDGYRYWYDYFEHEADGVPFLADQRARYREWAHEFKGTGYTFAMPVVYTWYSTFGWYDFTSPDYRWFYNMLKVGSNAGAHTPATIPLIPFVHWTTTAPPAQPDLAVRQFSRENYQELLWHLLLRGHDTFFLWCVQTELAQEIRLVHEIYAQAQAYYGFLERGQPISFEVPSTPGPVISGLRLANKVLLKRTDFEENPTPVVRMRLADETTVAVHRSKGLQILEVTPATDHSGFLKGDRRIRFPIGFYELPKDDAELKAMAEAGVNLVQCRNREDLDRVHSAGLMGWLSLGVQGGDTDSLRQRVAAVADHPALAVWEGPDEIVWTFTAYSALAKSVGVTRQDWQDQTPKAVAHAEEQATRIMPKIREGIAAVRRLDPRGLPFWINEAADSDLHYVRQYMDHIDVTGCDYYAVRSTGTDLQAIGRLVDRWKIAGRDKPVWMVLQGFSWHTVNPSRTRLYPTFTQSRFMAYDALVHGARGLIYWGSWEIEDPAFRRSLYALTAELAELEPFLVGSDHVNVGVRLADEVFDPPGRGVRVTLRQHAQEFILIVVNEDEHRHLGVDVVGLEILEGRRLSLLYGSEVQRVVQGGFATRLQGFEVKVFATGAGLATAPAEGRDYGKEE